MQSPFPRAYDAFGSVALFKFPRGIKLTAKKKFAQRFLKENLTFRTILEKSTKFKGALRKMSTKFLAGVNTKEVLYHENGCAFRFHLDKTYFSPRLSNERKEVASLIKGRKNILVLFAGVAPFSIVLAKQNPASSIVSVEMNRMATQYAQQNVRLNHLKNVDVVQGNVKRVLPLFVQQKKMFDAIVMPRPRVKETFLHDALRVAKKGTLIVYYGFCAEEDIALMVEKLEEECRKYKKPVEILRVKKAGDIGVRNYRVRVEMNVR